jgi:hypothetical protein
VHPNLTPLMDLVARTHNMDEGLTTRLDFDYGGE